MRTLRLVKRAPTAIEPALQYVLYTVDCSGRIRLSDLAAQVQLDVSTVSRHARALELAGYLERAVDPGDRRAVFLSLTTAGRKVLDDTFAARRASLDAVLTDWSEEDLRALQRLVARLAADLETRQAPPVAHGAPPHAEPPAGPTDPAGPDGSGSRSNGSGSRSNGPGRTGPPPGVVHPGGRAVGPYARLSDPRLAHREAANRHDLPARRNARTTTHRHHEARDKPAPRSTGTTNSQECT